MGRFVYHRIAVSTVREETDRGMRVALIYPDYYHSGCIEGEPQGRVHLGSGYLSAVLKEAGHETAFLHLVEPTARSSWSGSPPRTPGLSPSPPPA
jgi:hypothetical protein